MTKSLESPLVSAARTLAERLSRFEAASEELGRMPINSEKSLARAGRGLSECSQHGLELADGLRQLAEAMQAMQQAQQLCVERTAAATERVRARQEQRARIEQRLQELGSRARSVTTPVTDLADTPAMGMLAPLQEVVRRLEALVAEAGEVAAQAGEDDWSDIERETRSLEQQLQAAKNRVQLSVQKLARDTPS
jgi:chromosome segregation ATPase